MLKRFALTIAVATLAFAPAAQASDAMKAILGSYLEIHAALAADKTEGVKPAAQAIAGRAAQMGPSGAKIADAAKTVAAAGDLKTAREAFGPLSDAVIAAASADDWKAVPGAKLGYCPMAQKSWIQKGSKVSNPYYGSAMPTCGEVKNPRQDSK